MRLKLFCSHKYKPIKTQRGENLLGDVTHAVVFRCIECLKIKRDVGYGSRESAEKALEQYRVEL